MVGQKSFHVLCLVHRPPTRTSSNLFLSRERDIVAIGKEKEDDEFIIISAAFNIGHVVDHHYHSAYMLFCFWISFFITSTISHTVQMKMQSSSSIASSSFNTLYNIIPAKQRRTYSGIVLLSTSSSGSSSDEEEINDGAAKSSNGNDKLREVEVVDDASISKSQIQSLKNSDASVSSSNIKAFFNNNNKKQKFNRESLSKLGMSALLAYGFVSNVSGVIAVSCAWFIFSKKVW